MFRLQDRDARWQVGLRLHARSRPFLAASRMRQQQGAAHATPSSLLHTLVRSCWRAALNTATINTHLMNSRLAGSLPSSHRYRVRVTPGGTSAARAAVTVLVMTSRDSCVGVWGSHSVCAEAGRSGCEHVHTVE